CVAVRDQDALLDLRDARLGEQAPGVEPAAAPLRRPPALRGGGGEALQRHVSRPRRAAAAAGAVLARVERAEQSDLPLPAVPARPRPLGDPERAQLRADLQLGLRGDPRDAGQGRACRLRRHRAAGERPPRELSRLGLAARLPPRVQAGRDAPLRRLRSSPVLRLEARYAVPPAARPCRDAREQRLAAPAPPAPLRADAP